MDFTVGRIPTAVTTSDKKDGTKSWIEAKVLHLREPRRRRGSSENVEERSPDSTATDPPGARVMVLLVPDGYRLPEDMASGNYRVFLRLARA